LIFFPGTIGTCTPFSGISYEKIVQEKDPGNRENSGYGAWSLVGGCNAGVRAERKLAEKPGMTHETGSRVNEGCFGVTVNF
jgi:hypothetical protein